MRKYLIIAAGVVALIVVGILIWQMMDARKEAERLSDPKNATQDANSEVKQAVEKIFVVPKDEQPTVADVTDKTKLADKPFFSKAENGDKVLLYPKSQLAVIYRPSTKQIVNVASIDAQTGAASNNPGPTQTAPVPASPAPAQ